MSQTIYTDGLGYEGKVTLTLKSNNRVIQTKTYTNAGTAQLFKFLGYCLLGAYEEARGLLPTKIMLLRNSSNGINYTSASVNPRAVEPRSEFRGRSQIPLIVSDSIEKQVKVIYSFEVPKSAIGGKFNQIALYGADVPKDEEENFSAFYFLVDDYGAIAELDPSLWSDTTVLLIDWELNISNKNIEASTNTI